MGSRSLLDRRNTQHLIISRSITRPTSTLTATLWLYSPLWNNLLYRSPQRFHAFSKYWPGSVCGVMLAFHGRISTRSRLIRSMGTRHSATPSLLLGLRLIILSKNYDS